MNDAFRGPAIANQHEIRFALMPRICASAAVKARRKVGATADAAVSDKGERLLDILGSRRTRMEAKRFSRS